MQSAHLFSICSHVGNDCKSAAVELQKRRSRNVKVPQLLRFLVNFLSNPRNNVTMSHRNILIIRRCDIVTLISKKHNEIAYPLTRHASKPNEQRRTPAALRLTKTNNRAVQSVCTAQKYSEIQFSAFSTTSQPASCR